LVLLFSFYYLKFYSAEAVVFAFFNTHTWAFTQPY
jgi:hypothetical protein